MIKLAYYTQLQQTVLQLKKVSKLKLRVNANFIYAFSAAETAALTQTITNFQSSGVKAIIVASNQGWF